MYHHYPTTRTFQFPGEPSELAKARELLAGESRKPKKQRPARQRAAVELSARGVDPRTTQFLYIA